MSTTQLQTESLKTEVLVLLNGDKDMCNRLISSLRNKYPEKDDVWRWEKLKYDLLRDRA